MNIEIITIGDELLIGQVVDTNSAWMGQALNEKGFAVQRITSVKDTPQAITDGLDRALEQADIVLITGGLGPTKDDLTKETLARYFDSELVKDEACYEHILSLFKDRNIRINELTEQQAWVPACCEALINTMGTAPIMWFEHQGKIIVSMPGVPFEMKETMGSQIIPRLCSRFQLVPIRHLTLWVAGIAESLMSITLEKFEEELPEEAQLAYLPDVGMVRLRVSVKSNDDARSQQIITWAREELVALFAPHIVGEGDLSPSEYLGQRLLANKLSLGTAESCTGGALAQEITRHAGCSQYYKGGIVCYSNELKQELLGVSWSDLEQHGAVSQQVVEAMARGAVKALHCDIALATTGIAGPDGGSVEKPVGTVWIAVASKEQCLSLCLHLGSVRSLNISRSCSQVWRLLLQFLNEKI